MRHAPVVFVSLRKKRNTWQANLKTIGNRLCELVNINTSCCNLIKVLTKIMSGPDQTLNLKFPRCLIGETNILHVHSMNKIKVLSSQFVLLLFLKATVMITPNNKKILPLPSLPTTTTTTVLLLSKIIIKSIPILSQYRFSN